MNPVASKAMTECENQPDPERQRLLRSVFEPSSLHTVTEAVAAATKYEKHIYVERIGSAYRWSLTDPGGAYPLLRITARFLCVDYHRLVIGCRTVTDGVFVLCGNRDSDTDPDAWAVLDFNGPAQPADVAKRIVLALNPRSSQSVILP